MSTPNMEIEWTTHYERLQTEPPELRPRVPKIYYVAAYRTMRRSHTGVSKVRT